jgi:hypothetical protein
MQNKQPHSPMKTNVTQPPLMGARIGNRLLKIGEFVPAAALTARHLSLQDLEDPVRLQRLYVSQCAMTRTLSDSLPIETELKTALAFRLGVVNREIARFEHTPEFELPTIDPSFLSWKTQAGFPAFSIFRLDSDTMTVVFTHDSRSSWMNDLFQERQAAIPLVELIERQGLARTTTSGFSISPKIPEIMARHYLDANLRQSLGAWCDSKNLERIELTAKYGGVMPSDVREKVRSWLNPEPGCPRFDDMFIVAEAPEESWKVKEIPRQDPLVIGVAHGLLWLVAAYDLTPVEKFAHDLCASSSKMAHN